MIISISTPTTSIWENNPYHSWWIWYCIIMKLSGSVFWLNSIFLVLTSYINSLCLAVFSCAFFHSFIFHFLCASASGASFKTCLLLDFINEIWQSDLFILCEISFILLLLLVNLGLFLPYYFLISFSPGFPCFLIFPFLIFKNWVCTCVCSFVLFSLYSTSLTTGNEFKHFIYIP